MVLVRVFRVSSVKDLDTGRYGKLIELVEERREAASYHAIPGMFIVQSILQEVASTLQQLAPQPSRRAKITLLLTEEECERLGVSFEVNEVYEVEFEAGAIKFKKAYE